MVRLNLNCLTSTPRPVVTPARQDDARWEGNFKPHPIAGASVEDPLLHSGKVRSIAPGMEDHEMSRRPIANVNICRREQVSLNFRSEISNPCRLKVSPSED